ncbi:MAG TPA: FAD-linked oxidase C-terminal domain-containing protein [Gaiellaceae bacterium]
MDVDRRGLSADLRQSVRGEVRFDGASRALYATDAANYRHVPIGLVVPADAEDAVEALRVCAAHGAPVLPRGGGTSLAGQACNDAVVIDCSHNLTAFDVDPDTRTASVEPGVVLDDLLAETKKHGLAFGPDPATHDRCTLGGMVGNNSCGVHSVIAGRVADNVEELDVALYDGRTLHVRRGTSGDAAIDEELHGLAARTRDEVRTRYPDIPRRVSGYNLDELQPEAGFHVARALVGTEGTCALTLRATVRLVPWPAHRALVLIAYDDGYAAADAAAELMELEPIGLEGFDETLISYQHRKGLNERAAELLPDGGGWLLFETGAETQREAEDRARDAAARAGRPSRVVVDEEEQARAWKLREASLGATARIPGKPDTWPGWEDSAVDPQRLGPYLRDLKRLFDRYGYEVALYGHFGQGCVHTRIPFDLTTATGIRAFRGFCEDAAKLVVDYGGSLSGEHGDGTARAELLETMYGRDLVRAFGDFRRIFDPRERMNPGKIVGADALDANLRLGAGHVTARPTTHFRYESDDGSFGRAVQRCVGVGVCRRHGGGVMCPSYMVTRDERHSTRGRAHLLWELLHRDTLDGGWQDEGVKDALDLCLACKGCRTECPVGVDMATYKAEFLAHYYERRRRPLHAYALGLIDRWSSLASHAPRLTNALAPSTKRLVGIDARRELPRFATQTFAAWFASRPARDDGSPVVLWPDTFTNYFHPEVGRAAVDVLERAGFRVVLPRGRVCCGRPLYDQGMLDRAKRYLQRSVAALPPGLPVVGLEPSCVAVFRDELPNLLGDDPVARDAASRFSTLAELLGDWIPPRVDDTVLVQRHCHHTSVMGFDADEALLRRTGADVNLPETGCCGMAGSFGFVEGHYDVSVACAERALLPAMEARPDATLLADGFSCREQIRQLTGKRALHLAELLARSF